MNPNGAKRRSVLRMIGAVPGAGLLSTSATALGRGTEREFRGLSYDPRTHIEQQPARATLEFTEDGPTGTLQVAGFRLPIESGELEEVGRLDDLVGYRFEFDDSQFTKNGAPLEGDFQTDGKNIVGSLTRPSGEYDELSFTLKAVEEGGKPERVRQALSKKDPENPPEIPDQGIPTRLPASRIQEIQDVEAESDSDADADSTSVGTTSSSLDDNIEVVDDTWVGEYYGWNGSDCDYYDSINTYPKYHISYSTKEIDSLAPDELEDNSFRTVYLHGYFEDLPDKLIHDDCYGYGYDKGLPVSVGFSVDTDDTDETDLDNMFPQDDSSESELDAWLDAVLTIGQAIPEKWTTIGSTAIKLILENGSTDDLTTNINKGYSSKEYVWDINLDTNEGPDAFPTSREATSTVSFQVEDGSVLGPGDETDVWTTSDFTYQYPSHDDYCPCSWSWVRRTISASTTMSLTITD